jgi:hypothetical protein
MQFSGSACAIFWLSLCLIRLGLPQHDCIVERSEHILFADQALLGLRDRDKPAIPMCPNFSRTPLSSIVDLRKVDLPGLPHERAGYSLPLEHVNGEGGGLFS